MKLSGAKDDLALEALALSRNAKFMGYLDEVRERSKNGRTYSLAEIRAEFGLPAKPPKPAARRKRR